MSSLSPGSAGHGRIERERRLAWHRRRQHGVVTRSQALAAGWSPSTLSDQVTAGAWERWQRGVYAPSGTPRTFDARLTAALLRLRGRGVVVGLTAARLWRLPDCEDVRSLELAVGRRTAPALEGDVAVRAYPWLPESSPVVFGRYRTLAAGHVVADLCARWPEDRLLDAAADLSRRRSAAGVAGGILDAVELRGRFRGAARARRVAARLDPAFARTRSLAEIRAVRHLRSSDLPMPEINVRLRTPSGRVWEFDLVWRGPRAIIEIDGQQHNLPSQVRRDRVRDGDARAAGYLLARVPARLTAHRGAFLQRVEDVLLAAVAARGDA